MFSVVSRNRITGCGIYYAGDSFLVLRVGTSLVVYECFLDRLQYSPEEINGKRVWRIDRLAP